MERRRRRKEEGVAISFRVLARLIGSWQHMEPWRRFAHAHFRGNKYLPEGGSEREWVRVKKILISFQTHWEIKVGKTHPSKGCRVSYKMEIFPKLTDPVRLQAELRVSTYVEALRCAKTGAQRRFCINICAYVNIFWAELHRHLRMHLSHFSSGFNYFLIIISTSKRRCVEIGTYAPH